MQGGGAVAHHAGILASQILGKVLLKLPDFRTLSQIVRFQRFNNRLDVVVGDVLMTVGNVVINHLLYN